MYNTHKSVQIIGEERFSPDEFSTQTFRFCPAQNPVHNGDTVRWINHTSDGHSMSVVTRDQLPKVRKEQPVTIDEGQRPGHCLLQN